MMDIFILALATFFATIGPFDCAAIFAVLTFGQTDTAKRKTAIHGTLIAAGILLLFAITGEAIIERFGISLSALRTAGGILLLLIAIDMVFARGVSATKDETREAANKTDISVFPIATPLIAGPGTMGAAILLMADQQGDIAGQSMVLAALVAILTLTFVSLMAAARIQKALGVTGTQVIARIMGVLLAALAVQFMLDGIAESGII